MGRPLEIEGEKTLEGGTKPLSGEATDGPGDGYAMATTSGRQRRAQKGWVAPADKTPGALYACA